MPSAARYSTVMKALNESLIAPQTASDTRPRSTESATQAKNSYPDQEQEPLHGQKAKHQPGITYAAQDKLPKLPIPDLESTLKKYCDALLPLQTSIEHEDTKAATK